jgi:hypothetical protein
LLGSGYDGEVVAAARQAERLRRSAGLSWADELSIKPDVAEDHQHDIRLCLDNLRYLNAWAFDFLIELSGFESPSPQQLQKLAVITRKVSIARRYQRRQR